MPSHRDWIGPLKYAFAPLRLAVIWLAGTFTLFLVVGEIGRVPDMPKLCIFVATTIAVFSAGYWLRVKSWTGDRATVAPSDDEEAVARRWVALSGVYCLLFGLVFLQAYGARTPADIVEALRHPGTAYFFRIRDAEVSVGNAAVQVLTLGAALTTPLVPFTIVFWERISLGPRLLAIAGGLTYCAYWVFIGTQKGIGDFAAYAVVALLARMAISGRTVDRRATVAITMLSLIFVGYLVFNQSDRLISQRTTAGIKPNPVASAIAGDDIGRGVTTALFYPTHGYLGLAYNLETPAPWTKFRGSSRALDSYWTQYVDPTAAPIFEETLPARTEQRTGWPALTYWATIYPWIASDLTWPGAVAFMFAVGWWTARWWLEAIYQRSKLALLLVGQMAILIAYVPANNQIGITRPGLVTFVTLVSIYIFHRVGIALGRRNGVPVYSSSANSERRDPG